MLATLLCACILYSKFVYFANTFTRLFRICILIAFRLRLAHNDGYARGGKIQKIVGLPLAHIFVEGVKRLALAFRQYDGG